MHIFLNRLMKKAKTIRGQLVSYSDRIHIRNSSIERHHWTETFDAKNNRYIEVPQITLGFSAVTTLLWADLKIIDPRDRLNCTRVFRATSVYIQP